MITLRHRHGRGSQRPNRYELTATFINGSSSLFPNTCMERHICIPGSISPFLNGQGFTRPLVAHRRTEVQAGVFRISPVDLLLALTFALAFACALLWGLPARVRRAFDSPVSPAAKLTGMRILRCLNAYICTAIWVPTPGITHRGAIEETLEAAIRRFLVGPGLPFLLLGA